MDRELVLYTASSNVVEVNRLRNKIDGTYLDGTAQAEVTVLDETGTAVTGETWPVALAYVAASQGQFRAVLAAGIGIVAGQWYEALLFFKSGSLERTMRLPIVVKDD